MSEKALFAEELHDEKKTPVAESLRLLRERKRLSQKFVAEQLNMSSSTLSNYESGNRAPDLERLKVFADFYSVPVDYLFGLDSSQYIFLTGQEKANYLVLKQMWKEQPETFSLLLSFVKARVKRSTADVDIDKQMTEVLLEAFAG